MTTVTLNLAGLAVSLAIACGTLATTPSYAQTIVDMPTLSFPTKTGHWGCRFTRACVVGTPTPSGND